MSYNNIRKKLNKYAEGGAIPKYQTPAGPLPEARPILRPLDPTVSAKSPQGLWTWDPMQYTWIQSSNTGSFLQLPQPLPKKEDITDTSVIEEENLQNQPLGDDTEIKQKKALSATNAAFLALGFDAVNTEQKYDKNGNPIGMSEKGQMAAGIISQGISKGVQAVDNALMGDKNFSASSQAIDATVHGVSGALMKSGNPYAMMAGAALEGLNFITKAGGRTVAGYDVLINNSGYGSLGHQESESGRIWDNMNNKLAKRNEQARMALAASDISEDLAFEQEARTNSVTNVLQQNQIALAGGIDTSLLGS